ncbi:hypothetical protein [Streptomyces tricolor]|uniref:hypothetical protein n=1 Tax=Streptomyces tricolor TaxID=68277 RepID=UPI0036E9E1C8
MDPVGLRLHNVSDVSASSGPPWSGSGLRKCYRRGAARCGRAGRHPGPGARREADRLIGTGMASPAAPVAPPADPQGARARLRADGTAVVQAATPDLGTRSPR